MRAIFITYSDIDDLTSGSGVRPHNMYQAFLELGIETYLLDGQQNRRAERKEKVRNFMHEIEGREFDFCYIEYPSGPIFNVIDLSLIKKIHNAGIPIGLFYRDTLWLFPDWAWEGMNPIKKRVLTFMQKRDLKVIEQCCDIVYFPTEPPRDLLLSISNLKKTGLLPPGCNSAIDKSDHPERRTILYVGGMLPADGVDMLLEAVRELNEEENYKVNLDIVTRRSDYKYIEDKTFFDKSYIKFSQGSGDELIPHFNNSDVGAIPKRRHFYMDMAICVKLGEYMANDLPVISTDCPAMADFINREKCGIVCNADINGIKNAIRKVYESDNLSNLRKETYHAAERNLWTNRVKQVISDLL